MSEDDLKIDASALFGAIMAIGHEALIVSPQRLRALGVAIDDAWSQDIILISFIGGVHGVEVAGDDQAQAAGQARLFLSGNNAATVAASVLVHGEAVMGTLAFTAAFERELARVRHLRTQEQQGK